MEALNAAGLTPLSVLAKRTTNTTKTQSFATIPHLKNQSFPVPKSLRSSLVLLSTVLTSDFAKALTYDEALQQSATTGGGDIDIAGVVDGLLSFAAENPIIVGGAAAVLVVPVVVAQLLSQPKAWGVENAKNAYAKLGDDPNAQLIDIRSTVEIRQGGSPDLRGFKKKAVAVVYKGEDKPGFLNKLALKFKEPENTTLFVLDKFDGNSELVAELVTANGFKAAYAIKDGAEGPRGWKNSGLPWILPSKGLDFSNLTDALGDSSEAAPLALGIAAAAGVGLLAFTEAETILQVLGSAAIIQFVSKKLLFAEDRKQTLQQIDEILTTKVAPKEIVGDIQQIGKALLPTTSSKTLPAPAEVTPTQESEPTPEPSTKSEAATEQTPDVNSVPKAEVLEASVPAPQMSLSPYPNYPDLKPPSSPMPSKPIVEAAAAPEPTPEVNSVSKAEVQKEFFPVSPRALSPYPNYPDFKPPSSPIPSQP